MTQEQAISQAKAESLNLFRAVIIVYFDESTCEPNTPEAECFHFGPERAWRILSPYGLPKFRIIGNQVTPL
jgi:hypothetical protein